MKSDVLKEFASLKALLEKERRELQERLSAIDAALSGNLKEAEKALSSLGGKGKRGRPKGSGQVQKPGKPTKPGKRGRRQMSESAKARIAAAQRERWAKIRAQKAAGGLNQQGGDAAQPTPAPSQT